MVIFYSWSGNTRGIAAQIHKKVGGDLIELELVKPYSTNYNTCLDEAKRDQERGARPELKNRIPDMNQYDVVYLGYPNWWATIPMPIATLLETYDFTGKTIAPFCSHGGGRLGQSLTDIAKLAQTPKSPKVFRFTTAAEAPCRAIFTTGSAKMGLARDGKDPFPVAGKVRT